jgi:PEP-CTERM motif
MAVFYKSMIAAAVTLAAGAAHASYTTVDLSNYVNEGFTNGWFLNGASFESDIAGATTTGNQGSSTPFAVANAPDGNGGYNNYWFGLYDGPGSLSGPPGSVTIPVSISNASTMYTLADNTFGTEGVSEFSVSLHYTSGNTAIGYFVGGSNTKDYNNNCSTTGCDATPFATYWYVENGGNQWLQEVDWTLPTGAGWTTIDSVTFSQIDGGDGAIVAGLTFGTSVPEPAAWGVMLIGLGLAGAALRRRRAIA